MWHSPSTTNSLMAQWFADYGQVSGLFFWLFFGIISFLVLDAFSEKRYLDQRTQFRCICGGMKSF